MPRLTTAERLDLMNDPRMKDPQIRAQVYQRIDAEDRAWFDASEGQQKPPSLPGLMKQGAEAVGGYAKDHPAEAGAIVGGIAAMPFTGGMSAVPAMTAAGLMGAGGAGLGMITSAALDPNSPAPRTPGGVVLEMGKQGAMQAGGEGVGRAIRGGIQGTANAIQNSNLPKAIADDFPMAGAVMNRHAINPTTERGAVKATGLRTAASAKTRDLASKAEAAGGLPISEADIAAALAPAHKMAADEAKSGIPGGAGIVRRRVDDLFDAQFPYRDIQLTDAQDITRVLQDEGMHARDAAAAAERPSKLKSVVADNMASGVRRVARERIPGYQQANEATQGLIGAERAGAAMKNGQFPLKNIGWRALPAMGLGGAEYARSGDAKTAAAAASLPIVLGIPQISAPMAIAMYQAGRLPYALALKLVGPAALRAAGITEPTK